METLKKIALEAVLDCIFECPIEDNDEDEMRTTQQLIAYFNKLPHKIRDEIQRRLRLNCFLGFGSDRVPEARHVALLVHEEQKRLLMHFTSQDFNLQLLLRVSGHKFENVTELKLPKECTLAASVCKEMCNSMPNIQSLDLSECYVEEGGIVYMCKLPLAELHAWETITEESVRHLCAEESTARDTLKGLYFEDSYFSHDCYCLMLKSLKLIESMGCYYSTWLNAFSPSDKRQYNIRVLVFHSDIDAIEDELDIGVVACPKVSTVVITSNFFTPKMLVSLAKFKQLSVLGITASSNDVNREEESQPSGRLCLDNLCFDRLVEFSLDDCRDGWVTSGYLFDILEMCPNLERLILLFCDGFSNKIASELAVKMETRKLKCLIIEYCNLLGPAGIEDLLRIDSLRDLVVNLVVSEVVKEHFDAHPLQQAARKHGVKLKLYIAISVQ